MKRRLISRLLSPSLLLATFALLGAACPKKPDAAPEAAAAAAAASAAPGAGETPAAVPERAAARFAPQPEGARVAVLFTASVQGYVTPCGCTADPLGGVARLAAAVDEARAAYGERVVFLDAGDLLFEKPDDNLPADRCQAEARVDLLLSTYARKGLAATVRGPLDDVRGAAFRDSRLAKHGIPTVGVPDAGRALVEGARHDPGRIVDAGGVKVGVTGFTADDEARAKRVRPALEAEVARLKKEGAQVVIALAQAPRPLTQRIAAALGGLDVVIQGRAPGELPVAPERLGEGGPVLVAAGMQAQHLGVLELVLDERAAEQPLALDDRAAAAERRARLLDTRIEQYASQVAESEEGPRKAFLAQKLAKAKAERAAVFDEAKSAPPPVGPHLLARALALPRGAAEEEAARAGLAAYEKQIPTLVASCEEGIVCPEPEEGAATYVGVETCNACHAPAVAFWRQQQVKAEGKDESGKAIERTLSHATAWETLVHDGKDKDRSCVGCHSVGFNEPGGYCRTSDVGALKGVQCESCHGPGSLHVANPVDKQRIRGVVEETTCRGCHQVPHIPTTESFVFEDKLKLILGPGHGEKRLAEIVSGR